MFAFLCLVWGSTWIAMKSGTAIVPPGLFAGLRWTLAGAIMLGALRVRGPLRLPWRMWKRILIVAVLLITVNQLLMMYSLRLVGSGLGAASNPMLPGQKSIFRVEQDALSARRIVDDAAAVFRAVG